MYVLTPRNRVILAPTAGPPAPSFDATLYGTRRAEYDAQRTSTLTIDTSGGRDSGSAWTDYGASGRDFSQGTKANQPTYLATGGINNKPTLQFSAASNYGLVGNATSLNMFNGLTGATMFAVMRVGSLPASEGRIFSFSENGATSNTLQLLSIRSNADFQGGEKTSAGQSFVQIRAGTAVANTNYIICGVANAAAGSYQLYVNGTLIAQNPTWQAAGNFQAADASASAIGGRVSATDRYLTGEIGHILIYNGVLSSTDRDACFAALNTYWGTVY